MKSKSKYTASMTGCGFVFNEFNAVLPLLMQPNGKDLLKQEVKENKFLMMNSEKTRQRCASELLKRYNAVPFEFWEYYTSLSEEDKKVALLFPILQAYAILKELHENVVVSQWCSIDKTLTDRDLLLQIYNISSCDEFVDSWSDLTKEKIVSWYQTVLVQVGILSRNNQKLSPVRLTDDSWFVNNGEMWFLEFCLK